jgi:hypothetical protein
MKIITFTNPEYPNIVIKMVMIADRITLFDASRSKDDDQSKWIPVLAIDRSVHQAIE